MPKLTKKLIESIKPQEKDIEIADSEQRGLLLRVKSSGTKSFVLRYHNQHKQRKRYTIGQYPYITPEYAREKSIELLSHVQAGIDPNAKREEKRNALTVEELCDIYITIGARHKAKATIRADLSRFNCHIKPLLGKRAITDLKKIDIMQMFADIEAGKTVIRKKHTGRGVPMKGGKLAAKKVVILIIGMLNFAIDHGYLEHNVASGFKLPKGEKRVYFLKPEQLQALGKMLDSDDYNASAKHIIRLLLLTGTRRNEIASLKWSNVDFERHCLRLEQAKTGARLVPLGETALEYFKNLPRSVSDDGYIFPGRNNNSFYTATPNEWIKIRKEVGIEDCRIHDLRHTYASIGAELGYSYITIGALLGHTTGGTTSIYTHFGNDTLGKAASHISATIMDRLKG